MDQIIKKFNPQNEEHVKWLKTLHDGAKNLENVRLDTIADNNPFGVKIKPVNIPEVQFVLDAKYTDAIFEKKAHIL